MFLETLCYVLDFSVYIWYNASIELRERKKNMEETSIQKKKLSNSTKLTILAVILIAVFSFALTPVTFQNDTYYTIKIG